MAAPKSWNFRTWNWRARATPSARPSHRHRRQFHRYLSSQRALSLAAAVRPGRRSRGRGGGAGEGVSGLKVGERWVIRGAIGAYSEAANVPAVKLVRLPDGISDETAAASLLKGMTAQYLLPGPFASRRARPSFSTLPAGGVGMIACQWAKHLGVHVIGTVRDGREGRPGQKPWLRTCACC